MKREKINPLCIVVLLDFNANSYEIRKLCIL